MVGEQNTYISLFSSAGIGCFGFKMEGFECIASNELIPRRLEIQKINNKCKYESGYICGDITQEKTKQYLLNEVEFWKKEEKIKEVTVVMATPPCQGMSVANHKKSIHEIERNSLVIESLQLIDSIRPKFFVLENVPKFMKTLCIDTNEECVPISQAIYKHLNEHYSYDARVINFKNYGSNSSRTRTLVIGVRKDYSNYISPNQLFPDFVKEHTLRNIIGDMKPLEEYGEIDKDDIYHAFRTYPEHMRSWIHDLSEGQSAFDNEDPLKRPHTIKNGQIIQNVNKNGDKYTRQYWDKVGPCIHTRNDQLASQCTVHPKDDRVFSIRELMRLMSIPDDFKWTYSTLEELNALSNEEKHKYLKKNETNIRQCIGEAVPTEIIRRVAQKILISLKYINLDDNKIQKIIKQENLDDPTKLSIFLDTHINDYSYATLSKLVEYSNAARVKNAAYFTDLSLVTEIAKELPIFEKDELRILEPSVGAGNFIPTIIQKYRHHYIVHLDMMDIDSVSLEHLKKIVQKLEIPNNIHIRYINDDYLIHNFEYHYDLIVGNPPFYVMNNENNLLETYRRGNVNKLTRNTFEFFIEKALKMGDYVSMVAPKTLIYAPEFNITRDELKKRKIISILDFGECGFKKVLVETINILISTKDQPSKTNIRSIPQKIEIVQKTSYFTTNNYPYWILYRNKEFDAVASRLTFNLFSCFRDRQITNSMLTNKGEIKVLRSRNISDDGKDLLNLANYDKYISFENASKLAVYKFLNRDDVYLTPNMTYYPRVMKKPQNMLVNGSVAILIPKIPLKLSETQLDYYSSKEYRNFYAIARNYQSRSLNIESNSVFFFGVVDYNGKKD